MKYTASLIQRSSGRFIQLKFPYSYPMIEKVRSLPDRKWNKEHDYWICPITPEIIEKILGWGFELDEGLNKILDKILTRREELACKPIKGLKGELHPFQKSGVSFIDLHQGRVLIADEMGLGKTIQALAWIQLHPELKHIMIICPSSLKINWFRETKTWLSQPDVEILSGETPYSPSANIVIINYDILPKWKDTLILWGYSTIITDECHYYKTNSALRTKAVKKLAKGCTYFIALSGTPIENRPIEIYNAVKIINPDLFPNYIRFIRRYCGAKNNGFGMQMSKPTHMEELHKILKTTIMIRRMKKDVLKELPPKIYSIIPLPINNSKKYKEAERDFISFIKEEKGEEAAERAERAQDVVKINYLRQMAAEGKLPAAKQWIRDFLEIEDKLVIFCNHHFIINDLMEEFKGIAVKIEGTMSPKERQEAVDKFQTNPKIKLFIGNIKAAGVGITLTASSNVAFLEYPWTPAILDQAEDRCHRITQTEAVNIYNLVAIDSIDEKMIKVLNEKKKILGAVLDGKPYNTESVLSLLLKEYKTNN